ncbi:MAG: ParB/RepB/Spo0J family partition protein [Candidatus Zixiibacteriota bacterium]
MAAKKKALDRGLGAILGDQWQDDINQLSISMIPLSDIIPGEHQVRTHFDDKGLESLAQSIKEQGVLEPILLHLKDGKYEIIAGERRWRASKIADIDEIPAIIVDIDDPQKLSLIGLVENIQRENLNVIEEAHAYKALRDKYNMTQEQIAESVGRSRPVIANTLRILSLPEKIQEMVRDGLLSAGHTRILLSIDDPHRQLRLALLTVRKGLSVERLSQIAANDPTKPRKKASKKLDPELAALADELQESLATKVEISKGKKKGKLVIEFYDNDELYSIARRLGEKE